MTAVALHIVFFWVLGLTINATVVDHIDEPQQIEEIQNAEKDKTNKTQD